LLLVKQIIKRHKSLLCYEYDLQSKPPEVTNERIRFNGKGDDGYETFLFTLGSDFGFCKTAMKPYDIAVCECLIVLGAHLPKAEISSDGIYDNRIDPGWQQAIQNVRDHFGIDMKIDDGKFVYGVKKH